MQHHLSDNDSYSHHYQGIYQIQHNKHRFGTAQHYNAQFLYDIEGWLVETIDEETISTDMPP